ncbi:cytochrome-c peroxidase [Reinekea sp.]|jgi:cytochrome c peroxidase|uniref:cytochrome-c peroxidase n=1 Tax=Reinekea sp. TaxID=1970455 RepID=UPI003989837A
MRLITLVVSLLLISCQPNGVGTPSELAETITYRSDIPSLKLPLPAFDYTPTLPDHFVDPEHKYYAGHYDGMPLDNETTDAGATLGRVLFYDTRLSANNTTSCASCHHQDKGFSDPLKVSEGFQGGHTARHSMGLANARFYPNDGFFWDMRANTIEEQVLMPIVDVVEMGRDLNTLIADLATYAEYPILFTEAFGTPEITEEKLANALAQFVRSIVSYRTKFDEGVAINWDNFTEDEWGGLVFFTSPLARCSRCHIGTLQSSTFASNNGIDLVSTLDLGLGSVTGLAEDVGKFKAPSLRNVALTAPYMHDGRFATLDEVLSHYSTGIKAHPNLDNNLKDSAGNPFTFESSVVNRKLKAFLKTLTDEPLRTDEKFSNPFVQG